MPSLNSLYDFIVLATSRTMFTDTSVRTYLLIHVYKINKKVKDCEHCHVMSVPPTAIRGMKF